MLDFLNSKFRNDLVIDNLDRDSSVDSMFQIIPQNSSVLRYLFSKSETYLY